jgi:hypothetical protein
MQSIEEKRAAIITLLGLVFIHLDAIPGAAQTARQHWVSLPSSLDEIVVAPDGMDLETVKARQNLLCTGQCVDCWKFHREINRRPECPPDERWVRQFQNVRRDYDVEDVEAVLLMLAEYQPLEAMAVYAVFVEPWPGELVDRQHPALGAKTEAISDESRMERARLAETGLQRMVDALPGWVRAPEDEGMPKSVRIQLLLDAGMKSPAKIAKRVGCSVVLVDKVKRQWAERRERTLCAAS